MNDFKLAVTPMNALSELGHKTNPAVHTWLRAKEMYRQTRIMTVRSHDITANLSIKDIEGRSQTSYTVPRNGVVTRQPWSSDLGYSALCQPHTPEQTHAAFQVCLSPCLDHSR